MYQIKLGCLTLANNYADNFDQLFTYSDRILEYLKKDTDELRKIFYIDVGDMPPEQAVKSVREATNKDAITKAGLMRGVPGVDVHDEKRLASKIAVHEELTKPILPLDDEALLACVTAPVDPDRDLATEFHYSNYRVRSSIDEPKRPLRPALLDIAKRFETAQHAILNMSRGSGTSHLIAALARHYMVRKIEGPNAPDELNRILVLTNTASAAANLTAWINDGTVMVMTFKQAAGINPMESKGYSMVFIDNAAFIPYKQEQELQAFLKAIQIIDTQGNPLPLKILMASVPGQAEGWFYEEWSNPIVPQSHIKQAINWSDCEMDFRRAALLVNEIGEERFENLYNNAFRPITD